MEKPHDLLLLTIFVQGYHLWLLGSEEKHFRQWSEYTLSMTSDGVEKASIDLTNDKTYQPWTVEGLVVTRGKLLILETLEGDPFKPVAVLKKMKKLAEEHNSNYILIDRDPLTGKMKSVVKKDMTILLDKLAGRCKWGVKTTRHGL